MKQFLHFIASIASIANAIGDPRNVGLAEKIQIGPALCGLFLNPRRTVSEIMAAVDHRAEQIRILHNEMSRALQRFIFERHLSPRDGAMIAEVDRSTESVGERSNEFLHKLRVKMIRERFSQRRFAR